METIEILYNRFKTTFHCNVPKGMIREFVQKCYSNNIYPSGGALIFNEQGVVIGQTFHL